MGPFIQLKPEGLKLPFASKIIKAEQYQAYLETKDILKSAREKAKQIEKDAKIAFEKEKERGYLEGMDQGKEVISERIIETISKTIDFFEAAEGKIVDVVLVALKKVLDDYDDKKLVTKSVKNALQLVRNQKQVTIRVAPIMQKIVQEKIGELASSSPTISYLEVVGDNRLSKNDCILESDMGIIDASLDKQLANLEKALTKSLGKKRASPASTQAAEKQK